MSGIDRLSKASSTPSPEAKQCPPLPLGPMSPHSQSLTDLKRVVALTQELPRLHATFLNEVGPDKRRALRDRLELVVHDLTTMDTAYNGRDDNEHVAAYAADVFARSREALMTYRRNTRSHVSTVVRHRLVGSGHPPERITEEAIEVAFPEDKEELYTMSQHKMLECLTNEVTAILHDTKCLLDIQKGINREVASQGRKLAAVDKKVHAAEADVVSGTFSLQDAAKIQKDTAARKVVAEKVKPRRCC